MKCITITPQVQITQIAKKEPNKNFSNQDLIRVGRDDPLEIYRILLKFPITLIPQDAVVIGAYLKLYMQVAGAGQQAAVITPYALDSGWNISTVTWNNQPLYNTAISGSSQKAGTSLIQHAFDISSLVQAWYNSDLVNNGLILKTNEQDNKTLTNVQANMFNSVSSPTVEINYVLKCDCVCTSIFVEGVEQLPTDSSYSYSTARNTSLTKTVSFLIKNTGLTTVSANLQISPNGIDFADEPGTQLIIPGELLPFVPCYFAKYTRVRASNTRVGETSTITVWYQAQE